MEEVKTCKICGRTLPIDRMANNGRANVCKDCNNASNRQKRKEKRIIDYLNDDSRRFSRSYKEIQSERILSSEISKINPVKEDEVFVKLVDYKETWMSNCGRAITRHGNSYHIKHMKRTDSGEIAYHLYEHVWDGKQYVYQKVTVEAWRLVVGAFIVNHDIANNNLCWHSGNNLEDLYFKNLYPLNDKQYATIKNLFSLTGDDSEKNIYEIINNPDYQVDGWEPTHFRRNFMGVGYLGNAKCDISDPAYVKWMNMLHRCYSPAEHEAKPYYKDKTVCEEWHNFANFKWWFEHNHITGKQFDLDKDLLIQGNTVYSPEACALISHYTNTIFEDRLDGIVCLNECTGKYDASMQIIGKRMDIGSHDTLEDAWKAVFQYKDKYIKKYARRSKNKVPDKVYYAMMSWKVEGIA